MESVVQRLALGLVPAILGVAARHSMAIPVVVSLVVGVAYAASLPPWDYFDEEQHVDYIHYLVKRHELPVMGTSVSPEIITSVFETDRWARLGLTRPKGTDPADMGLEGVSYEAYQPPLFYLTMTVPYAVLPEPMLIKLYGLRVLVVLTGTISVLGGYALMRAICPGEQSLAVGGATLLALIPERAMAVARVNNDALAELMAIVVLWLLALSVKRGIDLRLGTAVGVATGLALLCKSNTVAVIPAVLVVWAAMFGRDGFRRWIAYGAAVTGAVVVISGWYFYRNLILYGDVTGVGEFLKIARFAPKSSVPEVLAALARGFRGIWWWSWPINALGFLSALAACAALVGLILSWNRDECGREERILSIALAVTVLSAVFGVWLGAIQGWMPSVQGRFILPAYAPAVTLSLTGMFRLAPASMRRPLVGLAVAAAVTLNAYVLSYLLPHEYPCP